MQRSAGQRGTTPDRGTLRQGFGGLLRAIWFLLALVIWAVGYLLHFIGSTLIRVSGLVGGGAIAAAAGADFDAPAVARLALHADVVDARTAGVGRSDGDQAGANRRRSAQQVLGRVHAHLPALACVCLSAAQPGWRGGGRGGCASPPSACGISPQRGEKIPSAARHLPRGCAAPLPGGGRKFWVGGGWSCVNRPWRRYPRRAGKTGEHHGGFVWRTHGSAERGDG